MNSNWLLELLAARARGWALLTAGVVSRRRRQRVGRPPSSKSPAGSLLARVVVGWWLALPLLAADPSVSDPSRLSTIVAPIAEALELTLDPAASKYSGIARIDLRFETATNAFRFHGRDIELGAATLDGVPVTLVTGDAGTIRATAPGVVEAGDHAFVVTFTNAYRTDGTALYKTTYRGRPYLLTMLAAVDARRAFPCWDEPAFKIPWRLTIHAPAGAEVIANMPPAARGPAARERWQTVEFGRSPPMPSYLVAFGVGPFESRPVPGLAVPGRVVAAPEDIGLAALWAEISPPLLTALERYFGLPYPYPKLDQLASMEFNWGGMENAGLITYRPAIVLADAATLGSDQRRLMIEVVAHEMAHMWFGDLVTMEWWDDVWLNESFATWMSFKVAGPVHPRHRFDFVRFANVASARYADSQPSVKPIRRPFRGDDNLEEAFDVLSYQKGLSLLTMADAWLGEERMRSALQGYFERHRWKNARAEDLWAALDAGGGGGMREALRRYVEQPGIPQVQLRRLPGDRLELRQERYRVLTSSTNVAGQWHVPVVVRYGDGERSNAVRTLLTNALTVVPAPGLDQARWLAPNAAGASHYVAVAPADLLMAPLARGATGLTPLERANALVDGALNVRAGSGEVTELLELQLTLARDPDLEVATRAVEALQELGRTYFADGGSAGFGAMLGKILSPVLDRVGLETAPGESPETGRFRAALIGLLGRWTDEGRVLAFCREQARKQWENPRSVDADIAGVVLAVANGHGDAAWFEGMLGAFRRAEAPDIRERFLAALGAFRDTPLVRRMLDELLDGSGPVMELIRVLRGTTTEPELCRPVMEWYFERYAAIAKRAPADLLPSGVLLLREADAELFARGRAFFLDPARRTPLVDVYLTEVTEGLEVREALRRRFGPGLREWLATKKPVSGIAAPASVGRP